MADVSAFYGRLQKQIIMKTDRLPPRERGLAPAAIIEVWKDFNNRIIYTCFPIIGGYRIDERFLIAIFKIYPKHK